MQSVKQSFNTPRRGVLDCMLNGKKQRVHKDDRPFLNATIIKIYGERRQQRIDENDKVDATKVTSDRPLLHLNHEIISPVCKEEEKATNLI